MPPQIGLDPIGVTPIGLPGEGQAAPSVPIVTDLWSDLTTVPPAAVSAFGLGPTPTGQNLWDDETVPTAATSAW